mgnify:CR=1 FL=1
MKKIILVPALLGVMSIGGLIAVGDGNIIGSANNSNILSKSEIEKKALKEVNGVITELEYEQKGLKSYYEVEVITRDAEYDLLFDAQTGKLLKKQKETFKIKGKLGNENINGSANNLDILSKAEIKKKALKEVNGIITELEYEQEGLKGYYEVEVTTNDAEYDLLFDAQTGELLRKHKETVINKVNPTTTSNKNVQNNTTILNQDDRDDATQPSSPNATTQTITTNASPSTTKVKINWDDDADDWYDDDLDDKYDMDDDLDDHDDDDDDRYDD